MSLTAPVLLVVNHGEPGVLLPLVESVGRQTLRPSRFLVWHNGPLFGAALEQGWAQLRERYAALGADPRTLSVEESGENLGFGAGINRLYEGLGAEALAIVANPDLTLDERCLQRFAEEAAGHPSAAVIGGALSDGLDPPRVNAFGQRLTQDLIGINTDRGVPFAAFTGSPASDAGYLGPSGALFAVARAVVPPPLFPSSLFLYLEDVALWLRLRARGAEVRFCKDARAVHAFSATTGGRRSANKLYFVERNRLWLARTLLGDARAAALLPFTALRYLSYLGSSGIGRNPTGPGLAPSFLRALRDGLFTAVPAELREYLAGAEHLRLAPFKARLLDQLRDPVR